MVSVAREKVTICNPLNTEALTVAVSRLLLERVERLELQLRENYFRKSRQSKSDIKMQIGSILIQSVKKTWKWPLLPLQMYRAERFHRQLSAGMLGQDPAARTMALLYDRARTVGVRLALGEVGYSSVPELSKKDLLIKASETAYVKGNSALELSFAEHALAEEESARVLARGVSAHMDLGHVPQAFEALNALRRVGKSSQDWRVKAALKQWSGGPLDELCCLSLLKKASSAQMEFIPNRVCYILHAALPFTSNGYATRSHAVASAMQDSNWDVACLTRPRFPWDMKPDVGIDTETIDADGVSFLFCSSNSSARTTIADYMAESISTLESQLRVHKPALVVAASNYRVGLMALVANKADAVWTLTGGLKQLLVEQGVTADKISMLPNGANPGLFAPRDRDVNLAEKLRIPASVPVFGYIGGFVDYDGFDDLVDAAGLLKRAGYEFRLLLVGNESPSGESRGGLSQLLRDQSVANGLNDWVIMPGRVPHDEVVSYYSLVDIAPFPRKALPVCELVSPLKPLQAMAMEKVLAVTDVIALAEIVEYGGCGIFVQKGSVVALADGMKLAIAELNEPTVLTQRAKELVETQRSWKGMLALLQNEMLALVEKGGSCDA